MDTAVWVIPLAAVQGEVESVGGKAANLSALSRAGFRVPDGFCVPVTAYGQHVGRNQLADTIRMELGRKSLEDMRWEEIWDAGLRIRAAFAAAPIAPETAQAITDAYEALGPNAAVAVRSSAPGEDSSTASFAGLHESFLWVVGAQAVLDSVRLVWASLWSDAALLYRRELGLDPAGSRMAVVVQRMIEDDRSGVAFGRDPRDPTADLAVVEAVPGACRDLVDGVVDPQRWVFRRSSGEVLEWRCGDDGTERAAALLEARDLDALRRVLLRVEDRFGWPPDLEWTGRQERLTLLQARPVTNTTTAEGDERARYLSFRPRLRRLRALAKEVAEELIPALEDEGARFADQEFTGLVDQELAQVIEEWQASLERWRDVYAQKFIPFAHGVRTLGMYYNDIVRPADPYEFVGLLRGQAMLATKRNHEMHRLSTELAGDPAMQAALLRLEEAIQSPPDWGVVRTFLASVPRGDEFAADFERLCRRDMDVVFAGERLSEHPQVLLKLLLEMASHPGVPGCAAGMSVGDLEERLYRAVGPTRRAEAEQMLSIGRLSWRLRDDDNLLLGRLESQLLRAIQIAAERLRSAGRLGECAVAENHASRLAAALRIDAGGPLALPSPPTSVEDGLSPDRGTARQLVGQPASPGLATGAARIVRETKDIGDFKSGEVLVCDAIQPSMTHLVPLAAAVVERRGGMLIHGAIIARELGIPCVNGVAALVGQIRNGEILTVDGGLGIVTVGDTAFDLELGDRAAQVGD